MKLNFLSTEYTRNWRSHLSIFESKLECALKFICSKNWELFKKINQSFQIQYFCYTLSQPSNKAIVPRVSPKIYRIGLAKSQSTVSFGLSPIKEMLSLCHNSISAKKILKGIKLCSIIIFFFFKISKQGKSFNFLFSKSQSVTDNLNIVD